MKTTSTNYKTTAVSCHVPAQATEWVYTSGYPALKSTGAGRARSTAGAAARQSPSDAIVGAAIGRL